MKKTAFYFLLTAIALMFVACEKGDDSDPVVTTPPVTPKVYDFWYFTPGSSESDTSKWETEDNAVYSDIPESLNSNLMLNYTFDNSIDNEAASGITSKLDTTASGEPFIKVDKTPKLCFEKNFTLSAWVYITTTTVEQTIISKHASTGPGYSLKYNATGISFYVNRDKDVSDHYSPAETVTCSIKTDEWHLVTAVFDGVTLKLYVDGTFKKETKTEISKELGIPFNIPIPTHDYNLYIGNSASGNTPFKGSLDQVMVFNTYLDEDEVEDLYNLKQ